MIVLSDTQYRSVFLDKENTILHEVWKESSGDMIEEEYQEEMSTLINLCNEYQIKGILADCTQLFFTISPQMQEWVDKNVFGPNKYVKKVAVLISHDLFSRIGVEQTMQEDSTGRFQVLYFADNQKALQWLLGRPEDMLVDTIINKNENHI